MNDDHHVLLVNFDREICDVVHPQRSNGSCSPQDLEVTPSSDYIPDARIPRPPWTDVELRSLVIRPPANGTIPSAFVGLWRLPPGTLAAIPRLSLDATFEEAVQFASDARNVRAVSRELSKHIEDRFHPEGDIIIHGIAVNQPGLPTVTRDANQSNRLIGLHLDNWDQRQFTEKQTSLYRIAINIGHAPRYFLFCEIDIIEMRERLLSKCGSNALAGGRTQQQFLQSFPEYPITRLRVEPGVAYIAPTDLIVHDGSTLATRTISMHFTVRGRFRFDTESCRAWSFY